MIVEYVMILVIRVISASRLINGGAAMLAAIIRNHHMAIVGEIRRSPWFVRSLREKVFS